MDTIIIYEFGFLLLATLNNIVGFLQAGTIFAGGLVLFHLLSQVYCKKWKELRSDQVFTCIEILLIATAVANTLILFNQEGVEIQIKILSTLLPWMVGSLVTWQLHKRSRPQSSL